ncbi:MAG: NADH-ubiquinone oxidoreductase-F iron-sulfur binding region domain-containing protein [Anaerovoracaceae bacterium]|jgi:NADH-quinone oxidoreductase subunit F|nr:NADH-quinone oxidoreductase subunit F [Clostridiales bacterium UBA9856]HOA42835.1 NADH-quinone oxidoreductase subunit NuoF [Bacillota bacterium]HQC82916.1 NADH-quinone oxidoreductase subunit NuoF [Bacillota bacterium]
MLRSREDLNNIRRVYAKTLESQKTKILVCAGTGCVASGTLEIFECLKQLIKQRGIPCSIELEEASHNPAVGIKRSGCHGFCEMGPLVKIEPQGWLYVKVALSDCEEIVEETVVKGEHIERLAYKRNGEICKKQDDIPFYKKQTRHVLRHCGQIDATSIKEYLAVCGYSAFEKALFDMTRDEIIDEVTESELRGRGGGGFPAGRKWAQVKAQKEPQKYVVCNGDEGDPGAFMDRSIMEGDPHSVLEGMMIAGLACGADQGYIYVRAEYPLAVNRLKSAIAQAEEMGLLGDGILGTDFNFHLHINQGAGAFVCGEGSALTASIEGKRGFPRVKPPRTVEHGLFDKPTVLNNMETFANIPLIIKNGVNWYRSTGSEKNPGTKAFALTGNIVNTGLIEVPMGTTLREVIFDIGGGMRDGGSFKGVQIGGPSGGCLTEKHLDLPLGFDSLKKAGAMIGSGGLVVMDDKNCMVEVARFFMNFTQNESCGKCVPCREGTKRMLAILERIVSGQGEEGDIELLLELADTVSATSLCGLGKTASLLVISTIEYFRDEYEAHIREKRCPAGACSKLKKIVIDETLCKGCTKCTKSCPVDAISGEVRKPFSIDQGKCIKCGACIQTCPFSVIKEG